jgi:hypothetical protein
VLIIWNDNIHILSPTCSRGWVSDIRPPFQWRTYRETNKLLVVFFKVLILYAILNKTFLLLLPIFLIFITACDSDETTTPDGSHNGMSDTNAVMPLKVGNWWEYRFFEPEKHNTFYTRTTITGDTTINGTQYFIADSLLVFEYFGRNYPLANVKEGLWVDLSKYGMTSHLVLKYPCKAGDTFEPSTWMRGDDTISGIWSVVDIDTLITIDAKQHHCIRYQQDDIFADAKWPAGMPYHRMIIYDAPNVGIIRQENYFYTGSEYQQFALVDLIATNVK